MASYQIIGVRMSVEKGTLADITHIAYEESFFTPKVTITIDEAIKRIKNNQKEFYVRLPNGIYYVKVYSKKTVKAFITSNHQGEQDSLLRLQKC